MTAQNINVTTTNPTLAPLWPALNTNVAFGDPTNLPTLVGVGRATMTSAAMSLYGKERAADVLSRVKLTQGRLLMLALDRFAWGAPAVAGIPAGGPVSVLPRPTEAEALGHRRPTVAAVGETSPSTGRRLSVVSAMGGARASTVATNNINNITVAELPLIVLGQLLAAWDSGRSEAAGLLARLHARSAQIEDALFWLAEQTKALTFSGAAAGVGSKDAAGPLELAVAVRSRADVAAEFLLAAAFPEALALASAALADATAMQASGLRYRLQVLEDGCRTAAAASLSGGSAGDSKGKHSAGPATFAEGLEALTATISPLDLAQLAIRSGNATAFMAAYTAVSADAAFVVAPQTLLGHLSSGSRVLCAMPHWALLAELAVLLPADAERLVSALAFLRVARPDRLDLEARLSVAFASKIPATLWPTGTGGPWMDLALGPEVKSCVSPAEASDLLYLQGLRSALAEGAPDLARIASAACELVDFTCSPAVAQVALSLARGAHLALQSLLYPPEELLTAISGAADEARLSASSLVANLKGMGGARQPESLRALLALRVRLESLRPVLTTMVDVGRGSSLLALIQSHLVRHASAFARECTLTEVASAWRIPPPREENASVCKIIGLWHRQGDGSARLQAAVQNLALDSPLHGSWTFSAAALARLAAILRGTHADAYDLFAAVCKALDIPAPAPHAEKPSALFRQFFNLQTGAESAAPGDSAALLHILSIAKKFS
jgi:hypothetical protein